MKLLLAWLVSLHLARLSAWSMRVLSAHVAAVGDGRVRRRLQAFAGEVGSVAVQAEHVCIHHDPRHDVDGHRVDVTSFEGFSEGGRPWSS